MNKALLIIDIQNDYFEGGAHQLVGSKEAAIKAKSILEKFRKENLPIIHIQHISTYPGATFFLPNTTGVEIHVDVYPKDGEKVIQKNFPNSFRDTELLQHLKSLNISDLIVCGMMTQMCVDTTVRAAKDLGFNCTLIGDACATLDLEIGEEKVNARDVQLAYLAGMNYVFADVITAKTYIDRA